MSKPQEHKTPKGYIWYRLDNDAYGNPRIMTHYLTLISPTQKREALDMLPTDTIANNGALKQWAKEAVNGKTYRAQWIVNIGVLKQWAKEKVNGKTYRAQWFSDGIVWQSYLSDKQIDDMIDGIQADE